METGADRARASRLRRRRDAGDELTSDEAAWLADYEARRGAPRAERTDREIHIVERHAEGEGDAGVAAEVVRAEGLRADTLLRVTTTAMMAVVEQHREMARVMLDRMQALEAAHVAMLDAIREERLRRVDAEIAAQMAGDGEDAGELAELIRHLLAAHRAGASRRRTKLGVARIPRRRGKNTTPKDE